MNSNPLNRPFFSYVITQSMLVLIVMAASFLIVAQLKTSFGIEYSRFWVSLVLVLFVQLPVAVLYARTETRSLSSVEGWGLSIVFVGVTLAFEIVLQSFTGQNFLPSDFGASDEVSNHRTIAVIGFVIGVLLAAFTVNKLLRKSIRKKKLFEQDRDAAFSVLDIAPRFNLVRAQFKGNRPAVQRNYSELYRRELIGVNIAIFGFCLMFVDPKFLEVLKLSIPLSFVFSLVCVANRMARLERSVALSTRCLNVALQMLSLTVVSMALLALSTMYTNYLSMHGGEHDIAGYLASLASGLGFDLATLGQMMRHLGLLFAICLAGNTLLLTFFTRLIRPLVAKSFAAKAVKQGKSSDAARGDVTSKTAAKMLRATELRARLKSKLVRTPRPFRLAAS